MQEFERKGPVKAKRQRNVQTDTTVLVSSQVNPSLSPLADCRHALSSRIQPKTLRILLARPITNDVWDKCDFRRGHGLEPGGPLCYLPGRFEVPTGEWCEIRLL